MKIEQIFEGLSPVLYHATSPHNILNILKTDKFELRPTFTKQSEVAAGNSKLFFLSTARTRLAKYHRDGGLSLLVLDGRKLSQRYSGSPIDYWGEESRNYNPNYEEEDRVYSDKPEIPNASSYIMSIDMVLNFDGEVSSWMYEVYSIAKKKGIDVNVYRNGRDRDARQNPLTHEEIIELSKRGMNPSRIRPKRFNVRRDPVIAMFLGLKFDPDNHSLSEDERAGLGDFLRKWGGIDKGTVRADFHNASSDSNYRKLLADIAPYMRRLGLKDLNAVGDYVFNKWDGKIPLSYGWN